jgi:hypothetical protein
LGNAGCPGKLLLELSNDTPLKAQPGTTFLIE